jgi:hypothetical protein
MHALENISGEDLSWIPWECEELLEIERVGLETWGGLRRRLPHTNPYQEHKNKRPVRRVGLTSRAKKWRKLIRRWGRLLPQRGGPNLH